jgi:hypothetical protein
MTLNKQKILILNNIIFGHVLEIILETTPQLQHLLHNKFKHIFVKRTRINATLSLLVKSLSVTYSFRFKHFLTSSKLKEVKL